MKQMNNQHQASFRIKTRHTSHQVEASPLRHPEAYLNIDEHDLPGVIRASEAILAHDFSKDMYSSFKEHAHIGNGVVAGFIARVIESCLIFLRVPRPARAFIGWT